MFGIGETELIIIVVFAIMVFGPDKLPGMGRTIGRVLRQFREAQEGFTQVVQSEVVDPLNEALNEPSARKRAQSAAAAVAEDADLDADLPEGDEPRRAETFAERKARLQAERESRAAAERGAQAEGRPQEAAAGDDRPMGATPEPADGRVDAAVPAASDGGASAATPPVPGTAGSGEPAPAEGQPSPERDETLGHPQAGPSAPPAHDAAAVAVDTSAAALYALGPRRPADRSASGDAGDASPGTAEGAGSTHAGAATGAPVPAPPADAEGARESLPGSDADTGGEGGSVRA